MSWTVARVPKTCPSAGCLIAAGDPMWLHRNGFTFRCEAHAPVPIDRQEVFLEEARVEEDLKRDAAARTRAHQTSQARTDAAMEARERRRNSPPLPDPRAHQPRRRVQKRAPALPLPFDPKSAAAGRDD